MYILLFLVGILLVIVNWRAITKEKKSFKGVFNDATINLQDIDLKIGEVRREFAETITELQREIIDLREQVENLKNDAPKKLEVPYENHEELGFNYEVEETINSELQKFYNRNAETEDISYNKDEFSVIDPNSMEIKEQVYDKPSENKGLGIEVQQKDSYNQVSDDNQLEQAEGLETSNNLKIEDVKNLFNQGLTLDEIAKKLNMGKGEVLLIKDLYLK
ncbi:DUF6115 domain-containing protein [Clostridium tunisiense]|uniref:DUF6115 domain-containing protein n=1 Tax=Clostridium tunisiense TaxID=219748 RepID=UPI00030A665F|nr:hypothetical protein [Clostridium tunisiense]